MPNVPPATVIYTGSVGAGQAVTALNISNVVNFSVDFAANTLRVQTNDGRLQYFDYSAITTVTWVPATGTITLT